LRPWPHSRDPFGRPERDSSRALDLRVENAAKGEGPGRRAFFLSPGVASKLSKRFDRTKIHRARLSTVMSDQKSRDRDNKERDPASSSVHPSHPLQVARLSWRLASSRRGATEASAASTWVRALGEYSLTHPVAVKATRPGLPPFQPAGHTLGLERPDRACPSRSSRDRGRRRRSARRRSPTG
jgi:hypothetical protein